MLRQSNFSFKVASSFTCIHFKQILAVENPIKFTSNICWTHKTCVIMCLDCQTCVIMCLDCQTCVVMCLDCQICVWNRSTGKGLSEFEGKIWQCKGTLTTQKLKWWMITKVISGKLSFIFKRGPDGSMS